MFHFFALQILKRKNMKQQTKLNPTPEIMGVKELAIYLGVAVATIYYYVNKGLIPYSKPAGKLFFEKTKIDAWLERRSKYLIY
jgi:excisionase family DNA binding protein